MIMHDAPSTAKIATQLGHQPTDMAVIAELTKRSWLRLWRRKAGLIPVVVMPMFFTIAYSSTFRGLGATSILPTNNVVNWMAPYAGVMAGSFAGMGSAFGLSLDISTGIFDRFLLTPGRRMPLAFAYPIYGMSRVGISFVVVMVVGRLAGMTYPGGIAGVGMMALAMIGMAGVSSLFGAMVSYKLKTLQAGNVAQLGLFLVTFLTEGNAPQASMEGWLAHVVPYNPITYMLRMARQGFITSENGVVGEITWATTWHGLAAIAGCWCVLALLTRKTFRSMVP